MKNRIIFLGDEINHEVANIIISQLVYMEANGKEPITLYINSPGGSVTDGLAIYDTMQIVEPEIKTVCTGMAASMASILLCAGSKGQRNILPNGQVLIHQPSGGTYGTAADMTIDVNRINKAKDKLYAILAKHTGQPIEKIIQDSQRDFWLDSDEALAYGCVDKIVQYTKK
jgi:ATP-dependent Clp protease protease subunit